MTKRAEQQTVSSTRQSLGSGGRDRYTGLEDFQALIRTAATEALPTETSREVAERFFDDFGLMLLNFRDEWVKEKLAGLISKQRLKNRRAKDLQYQLGFVRMPKTVKPESTIKDFRRVAVELRAHRHPALDVVERAIATMAKYTGKGEGKKQRITWAEVVEKEAKKAGLL